MKGNKKLFRSKKNRDQCDYRFDTHKWIDLAGADYLADNDEFLMIIFGAM